jgi:hypothetical protein
VTAENPSLVGLVLDHEDEQALPFAEQHLASQRLVLRLDGRPTASLSGAELGFRRALRPRPGIEEPQRRRQVQSRRFWTAVVRRDADQHVFGRCLPMTATCRCSEWQYHTVL